MKTRKQILEELEAVKLEYETIYLKVLDTLADAKDYVKSSRDERAEIEEQDAHWSSPEGIKERRKHGSSTDGQAETEAYFDDPVEQIDDPVEQVKDKEK